VQQTDDRADITPLIKLSSDSMIVMVKYLIVIEETATGYSAYSPDIEGCVATGSTREEVELNIKEAVEFHLEGLRESGYTSPFHHSYSHYLEIQA